MDLIFLILAFFAGIGTTLAFIWLSERRALSIVRDKAGAKGREVQVAEADELMAFMAEGLAKWNGSNKDVKAFMINEVPVLVGKYPRVAFKYGRKLEKLITENMGSLNEAN